MTPGADFEAADADRFFPEEKLAMIEQVAEGLAAGSWSEEDGESAFDLIRLYVRGLCRSVRALRAASGAVEAKPYDAPLAAFVADMRAQLKANEHKSGWSNDTLDSLFHRIVDESKELLHEIVAGNAESIVKEAADVANFAMMIADNARARSPRPETKE